MEASSTFLGEKHVNQFISPVAGGKPAKKM
jgi:hypothetical protein